MTRFDAKKYKIKSPSTTSPIMMAEMRAGAESEVDVPSEKLIMLLMTPLSAYRPSVPTASHLPSFFCIAMSTVVASEPAASSGDKIRLKIALAELRLVIAAKNSEM